MRRLVRNVASLVAGNALASVISLATIAIVARSVGPAGLGMLALIEAYGRAVDRLVRFEPWQAVVRYGIAATEEGRETDLRQLIKFALLFDTAGALAAALVAVAGLWIAAPLFGFGPEETTVAMMFSASLAFSVSSTMTGVLRIFDRFAFLATVTVIVGVARLALTALAAFLSPTVWAFGLVLVATQVLTHGIVLALGIAELRSRGLGDFWRAPLGGVLGKNPRLLSYILNTNLNVMVRQAADRFDVLVVGLLVGAADLGLYQLARKIGVMLQKVDGPLRQVMLPDVARHAARGDMRGLRRMILGINAAIALTGLAAVLAVAPHLGDFIAAAFGPAFAGAAPILFWQLVAAVVLMNGSTLGPGLNGLGADGALLRVTFASTIAFYVALVPLTATFGVSSATIAYVVYATVWVGAALAIFLRRTAPVHLATVPA